ncbi:polynucleotide 5'-hydroxyl-kinase NOL9 [Condylostylus longicornis]|uniref:polynucleotide 5'-hydroxyl-kinase NOL9 n=1 Tax=Condylostylus longicornis TaxID=2530218 RepID=UPI00244DC676|nr:polynucleotide 5'-hydroxyl-kinase NOL9 [Condylostylus longicornis]
MFSKGKISSNKEKYEKNLKQRLKKLFANDLIGNPEANSSTSTVESEILNEYRLDKDFKLKETTMKKKVINKEILNGKENRKSKIKLKPKNLESTNNANENSKKVLNKRNIFVSKEEDDCSGIEKCVQGPIATGYVLNTSQKMVKKKRKIQEDLKKKFVPVETKKPKLRSPCESNVCHENEHSKSSLKQMLDTIQIGEERKNKKSSKCVKNTEFEGTNTKKAKINKPKNEFKGNPSNEKKRDLHSKAGENILLKSQKQSKKEHHHVERPNKKPQKEKNLGNGGQSLDSKEKDKSKFKKTKSKMEQTNNATEKNNKTTCYKNSTNKKNKMKKQYNGVVKENGSKSGRDIENSSFASNKKLKNFSFNDTFSEEVVQDESLCSSEYDDFSYSEESFLSTEEETLAESFSDSEYDEEDTFSDDSTEYEENSDEEFRNKMRYNFDSESNDEDYELPESEEDLYIPHGIATKYDFDENLEVDFDSDISDPQIIEIPQESADIKDIENDTVRKAEKPSIFNSKNKVEMNGDSDSSCPQLVPINYGGIPNGNGECNFSSIDESASESTLEEISDCCSEYSELTKGSLCSIKTENHVKEMASKMLPEIFELNNRNIEDENIFLDFNETNYFVKTEPCVVENILANTDDHRSPNSNIHIVTSFNETEPNAEFANEPNPIEHFKSKFYNGLDSRQVVVLLKEKIHLYGTLKLQLLAGSVEIFGYKPSINEYVYLYSPKGYSFLNIRTCKSNSNIDVMECLKKFKDNLLSSEITEISNNFDPKVDAILLLEKNYSLKRIEFLGKNMKENLFPSMNPMQIDRPYYTSEFVLRSIINNKNENELIIDPKWETINLEKTTRLMIIGGKSVGKSTFLRYIVNKEIKKHKKILLVDLDVGQSEVFIPQTISATILNGPLLGPGYFLNLNPNKAFVYGDVNVVLAPERYLQNIKDLSKYCRDTDEFQNIPWVINTMGYNKGFGGELIAVLCHYLRPTDILQLQSENIVNNFDFLMEKEVLERIPLNVFKKENLLLETSSGDLQYLEKLRFEITSMKSVKNRRINKNDSKKRIWELYSKDSRYAMLIVRLGTILGEKFDWLTDVHPVCCCIDDIKYKFFNDNNILSEEEFLDIINANLVYMCCQTNEDRSLECFGIGIVRGIDRLNRKIYLVSSVSKENLNHVNCLAVCSMPLPSSIYLNQGPKIKGNVPYAYNTSTLIGSKPIKNFTRLKPV